MDVHRDSKIIRTWCYSWYLDFHPKPHVLTGGALGRWLDHESGLVHWWFCSWMWCWVGRGGRGLEGCVYKSPSSPDRSLLLLLSEQPLGLSCQISSEQVLHGWSSDSSELSEEVLPTGLRLSGQGPSGCLFATVVIFSTGILALEAAAVATIATWATWSFRGDPKECCLLKSISFVLFCRYWEWNLHGSASILGKCSPTGLHLLHFFFSPDSLA